MIRLYIGPSACGKDTMLRKDVESGRTRIVTCTTRPRRIQSEVEGVDYYFYNSKIEMMAAHPDLFEIREYHTKKDGKPAVWYYGSPDLKNVDKIDYVGVVDLNGVYSYIKQFGAQNIECIYLKVDDSVRTDRAKNRGDFDKEEWDRRLIDDAKVFSDRNIYVLNLALGGHLKIMRNN